MQYKISLTESFRNTLDQLDSIGEARRNPHMSERIKGHEEALQFLQKYGTKNVGVSMTSIEKLGINPGSEYDTPLGIYFYPADYYVETISSGRELPFVSDASYIQIFGYRGARVWDLSNDSQATEIENKLKTQFPEDVIDKLMSEGQSKAHIKTQNGILWYVLLRVSGEQTNKNPPLVWNQLIRELGFDVVVDANGEGIIHHYEPTQGVVVNPVVARPLTQIKQGYGNEKSYRWHRNDLIRRIVNGKMSLDSLPREFRTLDIYKAVVSKDGEALRDVPPELKTPELCKIAVSQNGWALSFVPPELINYELCKIAVSQDGEAVHVVPEEILQQHPELEQLAKQNTR